MGKKSGPLDEGQNGTENGESLAAIRFPNRGGEEAGDWSSAICPKFYENPGKIARFVYLGNMRSFSSSKKDLIF